MRIYNLPVSETMALADTTRGLINVCELCIASAGYVSGGDRVYPLNPALSLLQGSAPETSAAAHHSANLPLRLWGTAVPRSPKPPVAKRFLRITCRLVWSQNLFRALMSLYRDAPVILS